MGAKGFRTRHYSEKRVSGEGTDYSLERYNDTESLSRSSRHSVYTAEV